MDLSLSPPPLPPIALLAIDSEHRESQPVTVVTPNAIENNDVCKATHDLEKGDRIECKMEPQTTGTDVKKENANRLTGIQFALLYTCLLLGCFVMGYDTSCVVTLGPVITDGFNALNDLGWYATAYLLAMSATMLIYGQLYSFYPMKTLYMASFSVSVLGSLVAATAPTSAAFIVGRALSGLGMAGVLAGLNIIIANTTSLKRRPIYNAISGCVECIALAFGPLISGSIAHYTIWRVSFYIIIPIGIAVIVTVFFSIGALQRPENAHLSGKEKLQRLDLLGFAINIPMSACLVLALQWAGTAYPWGDWRIILLLGLEGVLFVTFLFVEHRGAETSMIPLKMLRQRTVAISNIITFSNFGALALISYYIALYFQAIRGASTLESGLMYMPLAVSMAIGGLANGPITSFVGYPNVTLIFGSAAMVIGAGLLTTLTPDTSTGQWIGYQILYGTGVSLAFQGPHVSVQAALDDTQVPTALVTLSFSQTFGGIVILSIAQNVFFNKLATRLSEAIPSYDTSSILNNGALNIMRHIPAEHRDRALHAYNGAIMDVFYIALGFSCLVAISALGMRWNSVKHKSK